jgi:hypothetical protein
LEFGYFTYSQVVELQSCINMAKSKILRMNQEEFLELLNLNNTDFNNLKLGSVDSNDFKRICLLLGVNPTKQNRLRIYNKWSAVKKRNDSLKSIFPKPQEVSEQLFDPNSLLHLTLNSSSSSSSVGKKNIRKTAKLSETSDDVQSVSDILSTAENLTDASENNSAMAVELESIIKDQTSDFFGTSSIKKIRSLHNISPSIAVKPVKQNAASSSSVGKKNIRKTAKLSETSDDVQSISDKSSTSENVSDAGEKNSAMAVERESIIKGHSLHNISPSIAIKPVKQNAKNAASLSSVGKKNIRKTATLSETSDDVQSISDKSSTAENVSDAGEKNSAMAVERESIIKGHSLHNISPSIAVKPVKQNAQFGVSEGQLIISLKNWSEIFDAQENDVDYYKYHTILPGLLERVIPCSIHFKRHYVSKKNVIFYVYCGTGQCKKYRLVCNKEHDKEITMNIFSDGKKINHLSKKKKIIKVTRYVRGLGRDKARTVLTNVMPIEYNKKIVNDLHSNPRKKNLLDLGNCQDYKSRDTNRKIRQEGLARKDRHPNHFIDMMNRCNEQKYDIDKYLHRLLYEPFSVYMYSRLQWQVLNKVIEDSNENVFGYGDATGGIFQLMDHIKQRTFLYSIVVATKPIGKRFANQSSTIIPVFEMISSSHKAIDIHHLFLEAQNEFDKVKKDEDKPIFNRFVCDFSLPFLYGAIRALNMMPTMNDYFQYIYDLIHGKVEKRHKITYIHTCYVHLLKNMTKDIAVHYPNKVNEHNRYILKTIIMGMFYITEYQSFLQHYQYFCTLLKSNGLSEEVEVSLCDALKIENNIEDEMRTKDNAINAEEKIETKDDEEECAQYKMSPFYKDCCKIFDKTVAYSSNTKNPLFNIELLYF